MTAKFSQAKEKAFKHGLPALAQYSILRDSCATRYGGSFGLVVCVLHSN